MLRCVAGYVRQPAVCRMFAQRAAPLYYQRAGNATTLTDIAYHPASLAHLPAEEFDRHYIKYLSRKDIDGWELRKALGELYHFDCIPEPTIIIEGLKACRRVNEITVAIRFLELVRKKCGNKVDVIFPWIMQEIGPTMEELGIPTLDELGYDKPELWLQDYKDV